MSVGQRLVGLGVLMAVLTTGVGSFAQVTPVTKVVLDNGLVVLACPHQAADVAGVFVGFRVGAEAEEYAGLRALIQEHNHARAEAVLASSEELAPLAATMAVGGYIRWGTEWDYTQIRAACPADQVGLLLKLIGQTAFSDQITAEYLDTARQRLEREFQALGNRAPEQTYYLFRQAMLGDVPLARPVFGTPEALKQVTLELAASFARRYFTAGNAVVAVAAPASSEQIIAAVREALGNVPRGTPVPEVADTELLPSVVRVGSSSSVNLATIAVGVALPPPGTEGFRVGQVLYHILAGPQGRLVRDRALLHSLALNLPLRLLAERSPISALPVVRATHPHLAIYAESDPRAVSLVHEVLLRHLDSFREGEIGPDELDRAKRHLINAAALSMQQPTSLVTRLGRLELFGEDITNLGRFAATVEAISKENIVEVAQTYFLHHYVGIQMPEWSRSE